MYVRAYIWIVISAKTYRHIYGILLGFFIIGRTGIYMDLGNFEKVGRCTGIYMHIYARTPL